MTTMTFAATPYDDDNPRDAAAREAGITAANNDHQAGTPLGVMETRMGWLIDLADMPYALGYAGQWNALALHTEHAIEAERTLAPLQRDHQLQAQVRAEIAAMEEQMSRAARRARPARKPNPKTPLRVVPAQGKPTVSLRKVLPTRPVNRLNRERTEARASLDAAAAGLYPVIPILAWTAIGSGTATALLADDTRIVFTAGSSGHTGTFLAYTVQPDHSLTEHTIRNAADLQIARHTAQTLRDKAQVNHMEGVADWHAEQQEALKTVKTITPVRVLREAIGGSADA